MRAILSHLCPSNTAWPLHLRLLTALQGHVGLLVFMLSSRLHGWAVYNSSRGFPEGDTELAKLGNCNFW